MVKASSLPNLGRLLEDNALSKTFPARSSFDVSDQGRNFLMSRSLSPWEITESAGSARSLSLNQEQVGSVSQTMDQEQVESVNHSVDQEQAESVNHSAGQGQVERINYCVDQAPVEGINRDLKDLILNQVDYDNPRCEAMEGKNFVGGRYSALKLGVRTPTQILECKATPVARTPKRPLIVSPTDVNASTGVRNVSVILDGSPELKNGREFVKTPTIRVFKKAMCKEVNIKNSPAQKAKKSPTLNLRRGE